MPFINQCVFNRLNKNVQLLKEVVYHLRIPLYSSTQLVLFLSVRGYNSLTPEKGQTLMDINVEQEMIRELTHKKQVGGFYQNILAYLIQI